MRRCFTFRPAEAAFHEALGVAGMARPEHRFAVGAGIRDFRPRAREYARPVVRVEVSVEIARPAVCQFSPALLGLLPVAQRQRDFGQPLEDAVPLRALEVAEGLFDPGDHFFRLGLARAGPLPQLVEGGPRQQ